ncbi:MAG: 3-hydroxyacyl-CoA dehydrogenase [Betaproteobacteria bacterium]|nr:3-hydroxyacyl-CoA dehydrogenase [Betaproteobacteria bacterium]
MLDVSRKDLVAGVAGSGTMGRGIIQVLAQCGVGVLAFDAKTGAAQAAKDSIAQSLAKLVEKGRVKQKDADATLGRIEIVGELSALASCHLVAEAIVEVLEVKREFFTALEGIIGADCIIASNTSSLSVTAMAAGLKKPGRVAGFHFFNPVPVMKIVEVVGGVMTEPWVTEALTQLAKRFGHTPVNCGDTPGFIVNHAGRAFVPEALRIYSEGIAEPAVIDRILVDAAGFRLGPFGLMDLVGLDIAHSVMKSMHDQYYQEPRYRPSFVSDPRVAAGLLGRKTGRGWYEYEGGNLVPEHESSAPPARPTSVWVAPDALVLKELIARLNVKSESGSKPSPDALCLVAPIGKDATTAALEHGLDAQRTVAVDPLFGFTKRRTLMTTPITKSAYRAMAHGLLAADGVPVSVIKDSPGFIAQRVVAQIVNVGCDICQQNIATPEDLDRAVVLGLGYPHGPLAMGDTVGAAKILAVLEAMHAFYKEPRYRPSPWLTRRARLGVSLLTPEN